jgi:hypothetical protein
MIDVYRVRVDALNMGAYPESGVAAPSDVVRLCNMSWYTPPSWTEAHSQFHIV